MYLGAIRDAETSGGTSGKQQAAGSQAPKINSYGLSQ